MAEVRNEINELSNIYVLLENVYMFWVLLLNKAMLILQWPRVHIFQINTSDINIDTHFSGC
jgi:hypothetical protein